MDAWRLLHRAKTDWPLLAPILGICAVGMGFGWYYYWQVGQFDAASPRFVEYGWWPLVSDSPNAVLLWVVAVLAYRLGRWRHWGLDAAAFTLNLYVGLWTTTLFLSYPDDMGTFDWARVPDGHANPVLFVSHMGMPLLSLALVYDMRHDRVPWWGIVALPILLAAFIWVDYWGPHLHPAPFLHPADGRLHAFAPWLMVASVAAWLAVVLPGRFRAPAVAPAARA